jgi:hypothetical protein
MGITCCSAFLNVYPGYSFYLEQSPMRMGRILGGNSWMENFRNSERLIAVWTGGSTTVSCTSIQAGGRIGRKHWDKTSQEKKRYSSGTEESNGCHLIGLSMP